MSPIAGDFGLVPTYGNWRDKLAGALIRYGTDAPVNHAFIYIGDGQIMEAAPGGARVNSADAYGDVVTWSTGHFDLTYGQRDAIVAAAEKMADTPYGWADIVAITLAQRRAGALISATNPPWWVRRMTEGRTAICSQLVDDCYNDAGVHLFTDHRPAGMVSPGDLYRLLMDARS